MICDRLDTLLFAERQLFLVQGGLGFCKVVMVGVMALAPPIFINRDFKTLLLNQFQRNVLFSNDKSCYVCKIFARVSSKPGRNLAGYQFAWLETL